MRYDKAFLISLEQDPQRRRKFYGYANRAGLEVEWIPAVFGREVDLEDYRKRGYLADDFELRMAGSLGTLLSHVHVWEMIQADPDCDIGLVFEDDAILGKSFAGQLEAIPTDALPENWDMLWLGWHRLDCEPVNDFIGKPRLPARKGVNSGHFAYLIRSDRVEKIKQLLIPYNNRNSKDVILRKNFDKMNAYFVLERIARTPRIELESVRKNTNNPERTRTFRRWLGRKISRLRN